MPSHRYELVEPIANVLAQVADCRPLEHGLVVWESAVRQQLVTIAQLRRLSLRPRARDLLAACSELSDSGIETLPVRRLAQIGIRVRQQVRILGHRVDGLIGDRLIYQVDGYAHHSDPAQRAADLAHDRRLVLAGYTVLRFDYGRIVFHWAEVESEIRMAMAQGLHLAA